MKKKICLVIVVYPGKLKVLKDLIKNFKKINFLVFFNNFKKTPITKNIKNFYFLDENILISRILMIKILKNLNFDYFIFHDVDDRLNKQRPIKLSKYFDKYDFIINDINTSIQKKYFSNRLRNNTVLSLNHIKNYNFAGMTNSACSKKVLNMIKFNKKDYKAPIFDWMLWRKIFKIGKGIFINKTISFYDISQKSVTSLPTNFKINKNIKIIFKIRKFFKLKNKMNKLKINNFWWEL